MAVIPIKPGMIIEGVVSQHAEEAAFLWLLREAAIDLPNYSLTDLAELDMRLEANLEGLRIGGEAGWEICKRALDKGDAGEVFAAAILAFESGNVARIQEVLESGSCVPELSKGIASALGWLDYDQAQGQINQLLNAESPDHRHLGISACALHRQDPGKPLIDALSDNNPLHKARALRCVGELGRTDLLSFLRKNLTTDDQMCRFFSAWSAALLAGDPNAVDLLKSIAESDAPFREAAAHMALRRMKINDADAWLKKLGRNLDQLPLAITSAGVLGDPERIPWLIEQMQVPEQAQIAGEAFTTITGVEITYELAMMVEARVVDEEEELGDIQSEDEGVEIDSGRNLTRPDPAAVQKWWTNHQSQFLKGTRSLVGQPIGVEWLQQVLRTGRQRQRAAAALELAIRQPGKPLFEVRAPGFRQRQLLG
ncbi:MAG: hypothetical protein V7641_1839 [Blastocatellia bacterium]